MKAQLRLLVWVGLIGAGLAAAPAGATEAVPSDAAEAVPAPGAEPAATGLTVTVTGIRYKRGPTLELVVYASDADRENDNALVREKVPLESGSKQHTFVVKDLPAGRYMIAGVQDSNANNELDTSWIGIPKEGYFTSNNIRLPDWKDCSFDYDGKLLSMNIEMIYW